MSAGVLGIFVAAIIAARAFSGGAAPVTGLDREYRPAPASELDVGVVLAKQRAIEEKLAMMATDQAKIESTLMQFGIIRETVVHVAEQQEKHAAELKRLGKESAAGNRQPAAGGKSSAARQGGTGGKQSLRRAKPVQSAWSWGW